MTSRNEKITKFLYDLKNGGEFLAAEEDKNEIEDLLKEVLQTGLVRLEKENFTLTKEGISLTSLGKTYDDYLNESQLKPIPTFQIGHLITGSKINNSLNNTSSKQVDDKNIRQIVKSANKIIAAVEADDTISATDKEQALAVLAKLIAEANSGQVSQSTHESFLELGGNINSIGSLFISLLPFMPKPLTP